MEESRSINTFLPLGRDKYLMGEMDDELDLTNKYVVFYNNNSCELIYFVTSSFKSLSLLLLCMLFSPIILVLTLFQI